MYKCIIFGEVPVIAKNFNLLYSFHKDNNINIVGISSFSNNYTKFLNFEYYKVRELNKVDFDYIILACEDSDYINYKNNLLYLFPTKKIIKHSIFTIPFFNINKYLTIYNEPPTIFSNNCMGGVLSNMLNLQFRSPLVNMWLSDKDYIKFLENPKKYLSFNIEPLDYSTNLKGEKIPTCKCGDIILNCSHYKSHEEAINAWNRRKERVNYDNIVVLFVSNNKQYIDKFIELPYVNKKCFVPFDYNNECVYKLDVGNINEENFHLLGLEIVKNEFPLFNLIDLLFDKDISFISNITSDIRR